MPAIFTMVWGSRYSGWRVLFGISPVFSPLVSLAGPKSSRTRFSAVFWRRLCVSDPIRLYSLVERTLSRSRNFSQVVSSSSCFFLGEMGSECQVKLASSCTPLWPICKGFDTNLFDQPYRFFFSESSFMKVSRFSR